MHRIDPALLRQKVRVHLHGAGGNGSQILNGLARLHISMRELGHPEGLSVTCIDPDVVSASNFGRSLFCVDDVGRPKSYVLINRINAFYGTEWSAVHGDNHPGNCDIVIGCVDSAEGRKRMALEHARYWLDLGNEAFHGQVVLGTLNQYVGETKLPTVTQLLPAVLKSSPGVPSCSLAGALEKQDLFINQTVATFGLNLLWQLFRYGQLSHHGYFINLAIGSVTPLPVDRTTWQRMGFDIDKAQVAPWRNILRVVKDTKSIFGPIVRLDCGHEKQTSAKHRTRCKECQSEGRHT